MVKPTSEAMLEDVYDCSTILVPVVAVAPAVAVAAAAGGRKLVLE